VLAWAYLELGNVDQAVRVIKQAPRRARAARYRPALVGAPRVQALVAVQLGDGGP
jgi:hypothetical protein